MNLLDKLLLLFSFEITVPLGKSGFTSTILNQDKFYWHLDSSVMRSSHLSSKQESGTPPSKNQDLIKTSMTAVNWAGLRDTESGLLPG